nr:hypothetical protein [Legionella quateirensis]
MISVKKLSSKPLTLSQP